MVKSCNVETCTRFTVTQWVIGIAVVIMVGMQGYIIKRVDKMETGFGVLSNSISMENLTIVKAEADIKNNAARIKSLETDMMDSILRENERK